MRASCVLFALVVLSVLLPFSSAQSSNSSQSGNFTTCVFQGYNLTAITGKDLLFTGVDGGTTYNWAIRPCGTVSSPGYCVNQTGEFCQGPNTISATNLTDAQGVTVGNGAIWAQVNTNGQQGVAQLLQDGTSCGGSFDREGTIEYVCNATATTPFISSIQELSICHYQAIVQTSVVCPTAAQGFSTTPGTSIISTSCGGGIYDLTSINTQDIVWNSTSSSGLGGPYTWYYRPCGTVTSTNACNTTANNSLCQVPTGESRGYDVTSYTPSTVAVVWTYSSSGVLSQIIQDGGGCADQNRLSNVTFFCNQSATTPVFIGGTEHPTCHYQISIATSAVCGTPFAGLTSGNGSSSTGGAVSTSGGSSSAASGNTMTPSSSAASSNSSRSSSAAGGSSAAATSTVTSNNAASSSASSTNGSTTATTSTVSSTTAAATSTGSATVTLTTTTPTSTAGTATVSSTTATPTSTGTTATVTSTTTATQTSVPATTASSSVSPVGSSSSVVIPPSTTSASSTVATTSGSSSSGTAPPQAQASSASALFQASLLSLLLTAAAACYLA